MPRRKSLYRRSVGQRGGVRDGVRDGARGLSLRFVRTRAGPVDQERECVLLSGGKHAYLDNII